MAVAGDGSIVVGGMSGYTFNGGDAGVYANLWVGKFDAAGCVRGVKAVDQVILAHWTVDAQDRRRGRGRRVRGSVPVRRC